MASVADASEKDSSGSDAENCSSFWPADASVLYGPAVFRSSEVIMVPRDPRLLRQHQHQHQQHRSDKEVLLLAELAELPLGDIASWSYCQKMTWLKCMLTKHLPQPRCSEQPERVRLLLQAEETMRANPMMLLCDCIQLLAELFDSTLGSRLQEELQLWHQVSVARCEVTSDRQKQELSNTPGSNRGDHLWQHILRLLMTDHPTVEWLSIEDGLFRFVDSSGAARSWGLTKGNTKMSYEKMSRSIRQYKSEDGSGVMQKAPDLPKLQYQFNMHHPEVLEFLKLNFPAQCQRRLLL